MQRQQRFQHQQQILQQLGTSERNGTNNWGNSVSQPRTMTISQSSLVVNRSSVHTNLHMQNVKSKQTTGDTNSLLQAETSKEKADEDAKLRKSRLTEPIQLNIWFHEMRVSPEDVLIDLNCIPGIREGDIAEIEPLEGSSKKLLFVVKSPKEDSTSKKSNFQVSIMSGPLQALLDIPPRSPCLIRLKNREEVEADLIEVYIKDIHLNRDDMWNLSNSIVGKCVYKNKRLTYLEGIRVTVSNIYRNGKKHFSSYVGENTKVVFRSESSRLVFMIQISSEMWHFEETGEIMFHKLINTLFPKIFQKWRELDTHHLITIVLFSSVDLTNTPWNKLKQGERPSNRRDFFRVVVDQVNIAHWDRIMELLRLEFANFMKEIILTQREGTYVMEGGFLPSVKGNLLEAINLGASLVLDRFRDTHLKHTTSHFIVITPGTGLFDVDYDLLLETSKKMTSIDVALDLICLSQPPLHVVPLLRYRDNNDKTAHCIPSWADISFWNDRTDSTQWIPRCKMYELQMMGVMENEMNDIEIDNLDSLSNPKDVSLATTGYDDDIFVFKDPKKLKLSNVIPETSEERKPKRIEGLRTESSNLSLRLKVSASSSKVDPTTTTSPIFGIGSSSKSAFSALTSLYTLSKDEPSTPRVKPIDDIPSLDIRTRESSLSNLPSLKSKEFFHKKSSRLVNERYKKKAVVVLNKEEEEFTGNQFWTEVVNPSKEVQTISSEFFKFSKWTEVFPKNIVRRQVKWRSLSSPASLPLTTNVFPSPHELNTAYTFQSYDVILNWESHMGLTTYDLLREMISLRLMLGFQIVVGENVRKNESKRKHDGNPDAISKYLPKDYQGVRMYLSLDNEIHRIYCDYHGNVNVQLYHHSESSIPPLLRTTPESVETFEGYTPYIRTRYAEEYTPLKNKALIEKPKTQNWNQLDQLTAGYEDIIPESKKNFHRMKFVILPADIPKSSYYTYDPDLTEEEIRIEGLTKLIGLLNKGRYSTPEEKKKNKGKRDEIGLNEISFYTGNLFEFLNQEFERYSTGPANMAGSSLFTEKYNKRITIQQLASELQSPHGITLIDRKWYDKHHFMCFVGLEFVSWLLENFEDLDTREEAADYGQSLMNKGLFKHVEDRHGFLDGHYFYEFSETYVDKAVLEEKERERETKDATSKDISKEKEKPTINPVTWFRKSTHESSPNTVASPNSIQQQQRSNPSTPLLVSTESEHDSGISTPQQDSLRRVLSANFKETPNMTSSAYSSGTNLSNFDDNSLNTSLNENRRRVILSKSLKYDVDPMKKSFRPEVITVHYDRVHNPEHCYHIRLTWLNTTSKLIDDTISGWSRLLERYGLRLVETPWKELCTIPQKNPFHSFVELKLALNPWFESEFSEKMGREVLKSNIFYYHIFLLQISGFLLDNRASMFFQKDDLEISYSWGRSKFKYAQYIHKTGAYIAEIRDNGDFFLAPNNIHVTRVNNATVTISNNPRTKDGTNNGNFFLDSQKVMLKFRAYCSSEDKLRNIFRRALATWTSENAVKMEASVI